MKETTPDHLRDLTSKKGVKDITSPTHVDEVGGLGVLARLRLALKRASETRKARFK